jgi:hypothetical protein
MTREEAYRKARQLAVEQFQNAKTEQRKNQAHFVEQHGRVDRIDRAFADDLRRLLVRTLAIAKNRSRHSDVKVTKLATMLAEMIGAVELELAQDVSQELFEPLSEREFLQNGYQTASVEDDPEEWVGEDATEAKEFLAHVTIVDPPSKKPKSKTKAPLHDDDEHCSHLSRIPLEADNGAFEQLDAHDQWVTFSHTCLTCRAAIAHYEGDWVSGPQFEAICNADRAEMPA